MNNHLQPEMLNQFSPSSTPESANTRKRDPIMLETGIAARKKHRHRLRPVLVPKPGADVDDPLDVVVSNHGRCPQGSNHGNSDAFLVKLGGLSGFDICIQDERSGSVINLNSTTGSYQVSDCDGFTLAGNGTVASHGGVIPLQDNELDRSVLAIIAGAVRTGTATIQVFSPGRTLITIDRNTTNNTCECQASQP